MVKSLYIVITFDPATSNFYDCQLQTPTAKIVTCKVTFIFICIFMYACIFRLVYCPYHIERMAIGSNAFLTSMCIPLGVLRTII